MFHEIKVRIDGQEKWVDSRKWFEHMIKEYSKVSYKGKRVDPYPDRVNKFYDELPKDLIEMFGKAYPNVDIKSECERARMWLLTNTNKAKKDFKGFTNRWLGKACQNGGSVPVAPEKKLDQQIKKHQDYMKQAEVDVASDEERRQILKGISDNLKWKIKI